MQNLNIKIFLLLGLAIIQIVWLITSPKPVLAEYRSFYKRRSGQFITVVYAVLFFQLFDVLKFPIQNKDTIPILSIVGLLIFSAGIVFAVWAKITMKSNWGTPAQHGTSRQKMLITTGLFVYSRNPIYVGLFAIFIGFQLALQSYLVLLAIPLFWIMRKTILKEESLLTKFFGKPYTEYCKNVPRYL